MSREDERPDGGGERDEAPGGTAAVTGEAPRAAPGETRGDTPDEAPVVIDEGETQLAVVRAGRHVARRVDARSREARAKVERSDRYRWWVLGSVLAGLFATGWTITSLTAALPFIREELDTTNTAVSWVVAAPFLLRAVFVPAFGKAGDLLGRKRVWVWGFGLSTAFNLLSGFAPDIGTLVVTRVLAAVAGAAVMPSSMALIADAFHPSERPKAMGWWAATIAVSPLAGVVTGGFLIEAFSWRWLFFSQFPLGMFALAIGVVVLRESRAPERQRFDYAGAALSVVGLSALLVVLNQGAAWGWTSTRILAAAAVSVVGLVTFTVVELRSDHPVLPVQYFRSVRFTAAVAMNYFGMFAYMGAFFITSLMLRDVFAYTAAGVALAVAPRAASLGVMGPLGGTFTQRLGGKTLAFAGMVLIVVSMFLLAAIDPGSSYVVDILPGLVIAGFGLGLVGPQASATVTNEAEPGDLSAASGALSMFISVGQSMGITVMQALVTMRTTGPGPPDSEAYSFAYLAGGVICSAGLLAALFIPMWPGREGDDEAVRAGASSRSSDPARDRGRPAGRRGPGRRPALRGGRGSSRTRARGARP